MTTASYPRAERVRAAIQEVLATELDRLADPGLGLVTVTDVTISRDLRAARVFYTVYGGEEQRTATREAIGRAGGHLRAIVARQVRLRFTPTLEFVQDPVPERASRLEHIIAEIHKDELPREDE